MGATTSGISCGSAAGLCKASVYKPEKSKRIDRKGPLRVGKPGGGHNVLAASPNNAFDHWITTEAAKRREAGVLDINMLLAEFQPQLAQGRKLRNTQGGYGILEARLLAVRCDGKQCRLPPPSHS